MCRGSEELRSGKDEEVAVRAAVVARQEQLI